MYTTVCEHQPHRLKPQSRSTEKGREHAEDRERCGRVVHHQPRSFQCVTTIQQKLVTDKDISNLGMYHVLESHNANGTFHSESSIPQFMEHYRRSFPHATILPKMHVLEDHVLPWLKCWRVGSGLMGEQGALHSHIGASLQRNKRSSTTLEVYYAQTHASNGTRTTLSGAIGQIEKEFLNLVTYTHTLHVTHRLASLSKEKNSTTGLPSSDRCLYLSRSTEKTAI